MNKKAIKDFAISARKKLIAEVTTKAIRLGVNQNSIEEVRKIDHSVQEILSSGVRITGKEIVQRDKLIKELENRGINSSHGDAFKGLIEEVAYTWFNRLIAIRFMEVNDYLPEMYRILSSETVGKSEPDIITDIFETDLYEELSSEDKERVQEWKNDSTAEAMDKLYQLVFIKMCNKLNGLLPELFERVEDYTELLFTASYIRKDGVIQELLTIPQEDFDVRVGGQVEIIGWLYQYYNTEEKDRVIGSGKIKKEDIPAATQLFTPDWIVRYMVENSLGRFYIDQLMADGKEKRTEKAIAEEFGWKYYIPSAEQPEDVQLQIVAEQKNRKVIPLQEIKLIDPSMGSGHILVYAFEVFMQLYLSEGEAERSAAQLILEKNLFGLDIDKRAFQLAYFALMMKGRQYNRRILTRNLKLNVFDVPDNFGLTEDSLVLLPHVFENQEKAMDDLKQLIETFKYGNDLGSLIQFDGIDFENLDAVFLDEDVVYSFDNFALGKMIEVAKLLQDSFEIVITNPPYMGGSGFNQLLADFAKKKFPNSKSDLFAMFIERWNDSIVQNGYNSMVTMQSWMFLSSYEKMRSNIVKDFTIANLMHMENMVMGIAFGTAVSIFKNAKMPSFKGTYHQIKTKDATGGPPKSVPVPGNRFNQISQNDFQKIPGTPISYWVSENLIRDFEIGTRMDEIVAPKVGLQTGDNNKFLRLWWEIDYEKINLDSKSIEDSIISGKKWFPYNKGGSFRRWYGNYDYVVNWENNGHEIRNFVDDKGKQRSRPQNTDYYYREAITWPLITSGGLSARFRTQGSIHDVSGMSAFSENKEIIYYTLGLVNSPIGNNILKILNPTINSQVGDFQNIPVIESYDKDSIIQKVKAAVNLTKEDWNLEEDKWDFSKHPLI